MPPTAPESRGLRAPSPAPSLLPWLLLAAIAPAVAAMPERAPLATNDDAAAAAFATARTASPPRQPDASPPVTGGTNSTWAASAAPEPAGPDVSPDVASSSSPAADAEPPAPRGGDPSPAPVATRDPATDVATATPGETARSRGAGDEQPGSAFGSSGDGPPAETPRRPGAVGTPEPDAASDARAFREDDLVVRELQSFEKTEGFEKTGSAELRRSSRESSDEVDTDAAEAIATAGGGLSTGAAAAAVPPTPTTELAEAGVGATLGTDAFGNPDGVELRTSEIQVQAVEGFEAYDEEGALAAGLPFIGNAEVRDALESTASTFTLTDSAWFNATEGDDGADATEAPGPEAEVWSEGWTRDEPVDAADAGAGEPSFGDAGAGASDAARSKTQLDAPDVAGNSSEASAGSGNAGDADDGTDGPGAGRTPTRRPEDPGEDEEDADRSRRSTADPELDDPTESWFVTTVTDARPRAPGADEPGAPAGGGRVRDAAVADGGPTSRTSVDVAGKCRPGYVPHNNSCLSVCASAPHYCYNNGRCYLVENLGAICRCSAQEYSWYKGAQCQAVVTDFQVGCVAVGTALLVLFLIFMLIVFFAKKLHSLSTENQQLRAKSLPKCQLEAGADNFSLSTVAVESCIPPPPRKSCQESPSLLPSARALNYYDNMLCTDDPNQKQEKNGESGSAPGGHGKPLNAGVSAPQPPHVPHAKPENTGDEKPTDSSHSFQNNLA